MVDTTEAIYDIEETRIVGADTWLETKLDHPEDVVVAEDSSLYTGGEGGQLYKIDPETNSVTELATTGGFVLGVALGPEGNLYACDFQRHTVFRLSIGSQTMDRDLQTVITGGPDNPPWHPNYCTFDSAGRLYISDSGDRADMSNANGCIYVIQPDGTGHVLTKDISAFPNGLALSDDESTLYVAETGTHEVWAVDLDDGEVINIRFITDELGLVDGLELDADGRLYAASIGDNAIYRYDLNTSTVETILCDSTGLTLGNPTNLSFGGPEHRTLYIANLALWHITAIDIDARGQISGRSDSQ